MEEKASTVIAVVITMGILVLLCTVFWKINKRYYREMERGFWDSERTRLISQPRILFYTKEKRYKEDECWIAKCSECDRVFLVSPQQPSDKMPWRCSGCGNDLTWNVPYTRFEVETTDGEILVCKNITHKSGWVDDMKRMAERAVDENAEAVKIEVQKRLREQGEEI